MFDRGLQISSVRDANDTPVTSGGTARAVAPAPTKRATSGRALSRRRVDAVRGRAGDVMTLPPRVDGESTLKHHTGVTNSSWTSGPPRLRRRARAWERCRADEGAARASRPYNAATR